MVPVLFISALDRRQIDVCTDSALLDRLLVAAATAPDVATFAGALATLRAR